MNQVKIGHDGSIEDLELEDLLMTKKEKAAEQAKQIIQHGKKINFPMQKKNSNKKK